MAATSRGIDVSSYQGAQDWAALAKGGLTFVQVKASEGQHTRDDHYRMHMDGILKVPSLLPQGYHFAWPNQDARAEADNYIGAVKGDAEAHPGFVHWLDLERRNDGANYAGCSAAEIRAYAEAWVSRVKAAFPHQRVGVYTSASDIKAGHYPSNSDALWYPAYPSGAMSYTAAEQRSKPNPGVAPLLWQFTSSPLDRSIAYMTPAQLRTWAGATTPEVDPMAGITLADINRAVWAMDNITAPADAPDRKTNPTWQAQSVLKDVQAGVRALRAQSAAQSAAITALAKQLGTGKDVTAIVTAVQAAIADAVVHVEVTGAPAADDTAPAAS